MTSTMPTPEEYAASICARRAAAVVVPFVEVSADGWSPEVAKCHSNVDRWVALNPGCEAVRGWITYMSYGPAGVQLTAHSVVRNPDGTLIDITPVYRGAQRGGAFVEHQGDPAEFFAIIATTLDLRCPSLDPEADAAAFQALIAEGNFDSPEEDGEEWE